MQIHGSGTGNWNNRAIVDESLGSQYGRLMVNTLGSVNVDNIGSEYYLRGIIANFNNSNTFVGSILANGSFTGSWIDVTNYDNVSFLIRQSATGSLYVENSVDASTIQRSSLLAPLSGIATYYSLSPRAQYFRLRYVNGPTENNPFLLQTRFNPTTLGYSFLPLNTPLNDNFTSLITKSVLSAKDSTGSYVNIDCTNGGNLKISVEDWNGVVGSVYLIGTDNKINIYSGTHGPIGINKHTKALTTIDYEHNEIHNGGHYHVRDWTTIASSGGSLCFNISTSNGSKWTHLSFDVYSDNLVEWEEKDYVTISGGTMVNVYNSNRNSSNTYGGSIVNLAQITGGSLNARGFFGTPGVNPNAMGINGAYGRNNEIILKSGTSYSWCFKVGANNTKIGWDAEFYEHTDSIQQF
jgi:hypothetical protein